MANTKDINSTERLLNVIRGISKPTSKADETAGSVSKTQKTTNKQSLNLPKAFTAKNRFTIGVDIGQNYISLSKTTKTSDGRSYLVDQKVIKYSSQPPKSASEFKELLKSSLVDFADSIENCEIWASMNSADVNIHHIKVPRVPKKQLENVIYWTAKKENPIDEKEMIFDFEMQGEIIDQGIPKYSVMVYSAPRAEVERVKNIFSSAGVNLTGITAAPFAIQNIFRTKWIDAGEKTFASLFIGHDYSRIDIYSNQSLVMTRGIKTGISSLMDVINEAIDDASAEEKSDREKIKTLLTGYLFNPEKTTSQNEETSWLESGIFDMISPVLERLIRQIERTLEYYTTSVGYEKVEKIYIASIINIFYRPLLSYISEQLGTKVESLDPFSGRHISTSPETLQSDVKALLVPAIGLSLSDRKYTPNIIFTYVEKNKEITQTRINRAIFATFGVALLICMVVLFLQIIEATKLSDQKVVLGKELVAYQPILSKDTISRLADDIKSKRQNNRQYAQKYRIIALIGELSDLTPNSVKLISVKMSVPVEKTSDASKEVQKKDKQAKDSEEGVTVEGVVLGERNNLDSILTQYVIKLERSPMLKDVVIRKSSIVPYRKKEIIQFKINAKIG